jgi:hypothetical protein
MLLERDAASFKIERVSKKTPKINRDEHMTNCCDAELGADL